MSLFKLHLKNNEGDVRIALYDPYLSSLKWEDNGELVTERSSVKKVWNTVFPTSPSNPGIKSNFLKKIKIQLGFACNYTCNYCSQNSLRSPSDLSLSQAQEKLSSFLTKMPTWFDGGEDTLGSGVDIEFWGGETLIYWPVVKEMTIEFRNKYPNVHLGLFTNGSLIKKEMADFAKDYKLHFNISHDGPTFTEDRGKDPLDNEILAENIKHLFNTLRPLGLISFNATLSVKNYSLIETRKYIADKLKVAEKDVALTYDLATPYDTPGLSYVAQQEKSRDIINSLYEELVSLYPFDLSIGMTDLFINDFFESLTFGRQGNAVGQKCKMDLPTSLAVDLDGNVLTCQNVTSQSGHKIGHVDEFKNIKLTTAYHWSQRKECTQCPVVQICKGSCMFLTDNLWTASCQQHFTWSLAYFAMGMFLLTERKLTFIEGDAIRGKDTAIQVIY